MIEAQEIKLRNNVITPMQFVQFMSHHFKKVDLAEEDDEIERLTEQHELEQEWDGEEDVEEEEDEVFHG